MNEYFESLSLLNKTFFVTGSIGTIIYLYKFILSLVGSDDFGEMDDDIDLDSDSDFKFFTIQTMSLFFMTFGWMGIYLTTNVGADIYVSTSVAVGIAVIIAWLELWLMAKVKGLEQIPSFEIEKCIGLKGQVYLQIPENGLGEVQVSVHGKRKIFKAKSKDSGKIDSFTNIEVVEVEGNILIVTKEI